MDERRLTVNQIALTFGIFRERIENMLHNELGMLKVSARRVPRLLTLDQRLTRLILSQANYLLFGYFRSRSSQADQASFLTVFSFRVSAASTTLSQTTKDN